MKEMHKAILDLYRPKLVPLEENLTAAVFPFMKIFPAELCLRHAREEGWITSQSLIVETSSGNMALGLAIVCNLYGYKLSIVSDYACDGFLRRRIEDLGARLEIVSAPVEKGGYQRARLNRLTEIREQNADHWWVSQYDNPCNPGAYASFAAQLIEELGRVGCLVGSVGSGGSVCGTSVFLHELFPEMKVVGVDTFGNLDHTLFDEVHWVTAAEAYKATRILHQKTSLFCGGTSGASWMVGRDWARKNPKARVVAIFPDDGYRYADTIYNDAYLAKENLYLADLPAFPREVGHPLEAHSSWSKMQWERRHYSDVVKPSLTAAV
jgi:cysteine synthase